MEMIKQKIAQEIRDYSTIIIHRHLHPDPDALGAQNGLKHIILNTYPSKRVYLAGEEIDRLRFIGKMDCFPDEVYQEALVIVCDTANASRISDDRYLLGKKIIKIDHHPEHESYGGLSWTDPSYSSACEMVADLTFSEHTELTMNAEAAAPLYTGIVSDTANFRKGNISPRTRQTVKRLKSFSIQPEKIHNSIKPLSKTFNQLRQDILMSYKTTNNGVAYYNFTQETLNKYGMECDEAADMIHLLSSRKANHVWALFIEYPQEIRARIRSRRIPVAPVARLFKGGGHPFAAGASLRSWDEVPALIHALDEAAAGPNK